MNNIDRLQAIATTLYGPRWQTDVSRALGVADRTVRQWLSGRASVPSAVISDLRLVAEERVRLIGDILHSTSEKSQRPHPMEAQVISALEPFGCELRGRDPSQSYDWIIYDHTAESFRSFPSLQAIMRAVERGRISGQFRDAE